ncbi:MAG: YcxB-like protein [Solirubrobacteraceae bacterium]|nr:YcxB-like protein [Solirubrobacteraceae bacterium]MEA2184072.1 YcxB-like protein [Solirubrobacteraceae bacterium]MEA2187331.1 YcxB-like protein [Solirubrobacteraceae bacterium]
MRASSALFRRRRVFLWYPGLALAVSVPSIIRGQATGALSLALVVLVWMAIWLGVPRLTWQRIASTLVSQQHAFDENGALVLTSSSRSEIAWEQFAEVTETPDVYVLRRENKLAIMVPARAFASAADEVRFRELVIEQRDAGALTSSNIKRAEVADTDRVPSQPRPHVSVAGRAAGGDRGAAPEPAPLIAPVMTLVFRLSSREFGGACRRLTWRRGSTRVVMAVLAGLVVVGLVTGGGLPFVLGPGVGIAWVWLGFPRQQWRRNPMLATSQQCTFDDNGILVVGGRRAQRSRGHISRRSSSSVTCTCSRTPTG